MAIGNKIINKASNNSFITTLYETNLVTYPYYLCVFTSDVSALSKAFICTDLSTHQERYNEFLITETSGTEILTSGTITLNPTGQWSYKIYGQSSSTNLDPNLATALLEIGQLRVVGTEQTYYSNNGADNTFYINE